MKRMGWEGMADILLYSAKPRSERKVGLEIERFGMNSAGKALHYRSQKKSTQKTNQKINKEEINAQKLLEDVAREFSWGSYQNRVGETLALDSPYGKVSLEPGSQLELATKPSRDLISQRIEIQEFEKKIENYSRNYELYWPAIGVNPFQGAEDIDVIPLPRYEAMTEYLSRRGTLATSMMRLTTSIQVNLDYDSAQEAIRMLQTALWATPLCYALFANSPFYLGKKTEFLSFRSEIWRHTDADRCGLIAELFDPSLTIEKYAELAWEKPLMFVENFRGDHIPADGASLAQIAMGQVPMSLQDVEVSKNNQLNAFRELFFEARLKPGYVEVRSIDGQSEPERMAAAAFWLGLLYSDEACGAVAEFFSSLEYSKFFSLWMEACRNGLSTKVGKLTLCDIAKEILPLCRKTLLQRGFQEENLLKPVEEIVEKQENPAQRILRLYEGEWGQDLYRMMVSLERKLE